MADVILSNETGESTLASLELSVVRTNGVLTANFDMLEAAIDKKMDDYRLVQYSDDAEQQKKELKQDRAALNKLTSSLKGMKKEVKEEFMKPWTDFESRLNKVLSIIEEPKLVIDEKIKELEEAGREEKRKQIRDYWVVISAVIEEHDFREQLYARLYNPSWENATATQKAFKEALKKGVDEYVYGMKCLKLSNHEFMEDGIREFQLSLDLSKAINLMEDKKRQKEELLKKEAERLEAERKRIEEEARAKAEAEAKAQLEAERLRIEAEAKAKAEAERLRIEAEAKAKAEVEAKAQFEAEKLRIAAEAKAKAEAEAKIKAEDEKKAGLAVSNTSSPSASVLQTTNITAQTGSAEKEVVVTFEASKWPLIQKYCDRLGVTYKTN